MNHTRLALASRDLATTSPNLAGFDPTILLQILALFLPGLASMFTMCFGPAPTPAAIKEHLAHVYSPALYRNGTCYDNGTMRPAIKLAMRSARGTGDLITWEQAQAIAVAGLDATRLAHDDVVQEELTAAAA